MPDGSGEFEDELEGVLGSEGEELEDVDRSWVLFYPGFRCELNLSSTSGVEQNVVHMEFALKRAGVNCGLRNGQ